MMGSELTTTIQDSILDLEDTTPKTGSLHCSEGVKKADGILGITREAVKN